jgi:hypothetical protein
MGPYLRRLVFCGALTSLSGFAGCGTAGLNGFLADLGQQKITNAEFEEHRKQFSQEKDPQAFRWLMAHSLNNGMTVKEVERALGDVGERIYDDVELKSHHGEFLHTDVAYKWGPDTDGNSAVLFFREGRLIQFEAGKFRAAAKPEVW